MHKLYTEIQNRYIHITNIGSGKLDTFLPAILQERLPIHSGTEVQIFLIEFPGWSWNWDTNFSEDEEYQEEDDSLVFNTTVPEPHSLKTIKTQLFSNLNHPPPKSKTEI